MEKRNVIGEGLKRAKGPVEQARTATLEDAQAARKVLHALAAQIKAAGSSYLAIIDAAACAYAGFCAQQAIQRADDIAAGRKPAPMPKDIAKVAEKDAEEQAGEDE